MKLKKITTIIITLLVVFAMSGCASAANTATTTSTAPSPTTDEVTAATEHTTEGEAQGNMPKGSAPGEFPGATESAATQGDNSTGSLLVIDEQFTERDLEQIADLSKATKLSITSGKDINITEEGVYVISGEATDSSIIVDAGKDAKVQIVLNGVKITNSSTPAIYVKTADKVFVTTTEGTNTLSVNGVFEADGDTNTDAVIYSKSDITLNGKGTLVVNSTEGNGITSKDDLKITGGVYDITSKADGLEANDSIRIYAGDITIETAKDALHSENDDDSSLGFIYIKGGSLQITAGDDAIHGTSVIQIDGGTIDIKTCTEGIEATTIQINGGDIDIYATDDGINAAAKSELGVAIIVNGGDIYVKMGSGDTDGFDSNGALYINGGTISVDANSAFDADGTTELNGGDVTVNGEKVTEISVQHMGGGGGKRGPH